MAALRSGMPMLGRCCSGSSSAASMRGKKGWRSTKFSVLRGHRSTLQPSVTSREWLLQSWHRFSTGGGGPKGKTESFPRILWQWAKYRVKNADPITKSKAVAAYGAVVMGTPMICLVHVTKKYNA